MQTNKVSLTVDPRHPKLLTDNYVFTVPGCTYEIR